MSYHDPSRTFLSSEELLSWRANQPIRTKKVSESGSEPVTLAEMKAQLNIAESDTAHDVRITRLIKAARQKYEYDASLNLLSATHDDTFEQFYDRMRLTQRHVTSISSVTYFDAQNTQQTLASSVYAFDSSLRELRLAVDQSWPSTQERYDAVVVRYVSASSPVPETAKHAIILLASFWFEMADMIINPNMVANSAYESLVAVHQRSTYP